MNVFGPNPLEVFWLSYRENPAFFMMACGLIGSLVAFWVRMRIDRRAADRLEEMLDAAATRLNSPSLPDEPLVIEADQETRRRLDALELERRRGIAQDELSKRPGWFSKSLSEYATLARYDEPIYSTDWFCGARCKAVQRAFTVDKVRFFENPVGQKDAHQLYISPSATNLRCYGMLGVPLHAHFNKISVVFEDFQDRGDVERLIASACVRVIVSYDTIVCQRPLSMFKPVVPEGVDQKGLLAMAQGAPPLFWARLEAPIEDLWVGPHQAFWAELDLPTELRLEGCVKVKLAMGPHLFRTVGPGHADDQKYGAKRLDYPLSSL